jgi:hypothetical protein
LANIHKIRTLVLSNPNLNSDQRGGNDGMIPRGIDLISIPLILAASRQTIIPECVATQRLLLGNWGYDNDNFLNFGEGHKIKPIYRLEVELTVSQCLNTIVEMHKMHWAKQRHDEKDEAIIFDRSGICRHFHRHSHEIHFLTIWLCGEHNSTANDPIFPN